MMREMSLLECFQTGSDEIWFVFFEAVDLWPYQ
jgi:hypothetical protein